MKDRFTGCMIGSALGDAIGEIVLYRARRGFIPLEQRSLVIDKDTLLSAVQTFPELKYTDDTHMAIGIAEAIANPGRLELDPIKRRFLVNYQAEPWRGYGTGPTAILSMTLLGKCTYDEAVKRVNANYDGGSLGNGAAMRTHPVALRYHAFPDLSGIARRIAALTHLHPVGQDAAAVLTAAVAYLLRHSERELVTEVVLEHLLGTAETAEIHEKLALIATLLDGPVKPAEALKSLGCGVEAHKSLPFALYAFLLHPRSFQDCLYTAILNGGDADTLGAMAGSLAGAWLGIEGIPGGWIDKLENRNYILELAHRLYDAQLQDSQ